MRDILDKLDQLAEAAITTSTNKYGGKYLEILQHKIANGEPVELVPELHDTVGKEVMLTKDNIDKINQAWFGQPEFPEIANMNLDPNGLIIPATKNANSVELTTVDGDTVRLTQIQKTADFKGGKPFNSGDVSEGLLGAAVAARFIARDKDIATQDIISVLKDLGPGSIAGRTGNNLQGTTRGRSKNDSVEYKLALNQANYKMLQTVANDPANTHPDITKMINSAVIFANTNPGVLAAVDKIVDDPDANQVVVSSDGVSEQSGTKADLFLSIDGSTVNLLSLKAGDVKQFGQVSGYNFRAIQQFFEQTLGATIPDSLRTADAEDPREAFNDIQAAYREAEKDISEELAGQRPAKEADFVERLYKGIAYHATRNDAGISMVILNTGAVPGYKELGFGPELDKAMRQVDLDVALNQKDNSSVLQIFGTKTDGTRSQLLQMRSNYQIESGKPYVRNRVEMGPLLKEIALIEKEERKPKAAKQAAQGLDKSALGRKRRNES